MNDFIFFQSLLANGPSHPQNKYMKLENEFERSNQRFAEDNYQEQQVNEWCTILSLWCTVSVIHVPASSCIMAEVVVAYMKLIWEINQKIPDSLTEK